MPPLSACLDGSETACERHGFQQWLADTDHVVERYHLEKDVVDVAVGVEGNGGHRAFDPPVVVVRSGATVRWIWTGEGNAHSVTDECEIFDSGLESAGGHIFEYRFDDPGVYTYRCEEHDDDGMRGVVRVE